MLPTCSILVQSKYVFELKHDQVTSNKKHILNRKMIKSLFSAPFKTESDLFQTEDAGFDSYDVRIISIKIVIYIEKWQVVT